MPYCKNGIDKLELDQNYEQQQQKLGSMSLGKIFGKM